MQLCDFYKPKKAYSQEVIEIAKKIKDAPDGSGGFIIPELLEGLTYNKDWKVRVDHKDRRVFIIFYAKDNEVGADEVGSYFEVLYGLTSIVNALQFLEGEGKILRFSEASPDSRMLVSCWGPAVEEGQKVYIEVVDDRVRDFLLSADGVGIYKTVQLKALQERGFVDDDERRHHVNMVAAFLGISVSIVIGLSGFLITYLTSCCS